MVNASTEAAILAVREWVLSLQSGSADMTEADMKHEYVIEIKPRKENAADIAFRMSKHRAVFGLYVGKWLRIDSLPLSAEYLIEICEGVRGGHVVEETWTWHGTMLQAKGTLRLSSGDLANIEYMWMLGRLGADQHRERSWEPW